MIIRIKKTNQSKRVGLLGLAAFCLTLCVARTGLTEAQANEPIRYLALSESRADQPRPGCTDVGGIPFLARTKTLVPVDGSCNLKMGFAARHVFLIGMTNYRSIANPGWFLPDQHHRRFWLGDRLGTIRVKYADNVTETYPLLTGEGILWDKRYYNFPKPFTSDPKAMAALKQLLRVYPAEPVKDGHYLAVIAPRPIAIASIEIEDAKEKEGSPVVLGVTVEVDQTEQPSCWAELPAKPVAPEVAAFIREKPLRLEGVREKEAQAQMAKLRPFIYQSVEQLPKRVNLKIPKGYSGPTVRFEGGIEADILTAVFHHTVNDMLGKIRDTGQYGLSSKGAPDYGQYEAFGTFQTGLGGGWDWCYARDMGRSLQELLALGFEDKGRRCADYALKMARMWEGDPGAGTGIRIGKLDVDGNGVPRHFARVINKLDSTPGNGCFENDGHGLVSLFIYNLWRRIPDRDEWLRTRWDDVKGLGDWVVWQFDHPEISQATDVLWTDSECAQMQETSRGPALYADFLCREALLGLADMADSIGQTEKAALWRATAGRLQKGIDRNYIISDPKYGRVWTLYGTGWPNKSTVLATTINLPDRRGLAPEDDDWRWRRITEASYERLIKTYKPFGFYGVAMGYGQGFVTQSALLLDKMNDAGVMLDWMARLIYDPKCQPFIVPEGCDLDPAGRYWYRSGDLGNGVQEAEIIKALRLIIGIDDTQPETIRIFPRLPLAWTGIEVKDIPVFVGAGFQIPPHRLGISYKLARIGEGMRLALTSDAPLPKLAVRLGAFKNRPQADWVTIDGKKTDARVELSGDSWWVRAEVPAGRKKFVLDVR